jgi:oligopeptide/dipeptide ABC transporter ATP-binding protein
MNGPLLQTEQLTVGYHMPDGRVLRAVDGIDLAVGRGETFGVIGESGSGKTTLGRTLVCLERPSSGRVMHGGTDPNALSRRALARHRRNYQIVFQDPNAALDPRMTILEAVREPLDATADMPRRERRDRAVAMLERVGLSADFMRRYPHELSGGQKQRVCIARVLTLYPALIVCDEAVAALDVSIQAEILNLFADLQHEFGLTYVFITHNLSVVAHLADRIAVMYLGRLMELGGTEALMAHPLHPYTEALLSAEPVALPTVLRARARPEGRMVLQGETPSPIDPPSGCPFRTRCPHAKPVCAAERPAWREISAGHFAACHFAGEVTAARRTAS